MGSGGLSSDQWIYLRYYDGWGNLGGGSGGGENDPPPPRQPYEWEYTESVSGFVREAIDRISTHPATVSKKAALINRGGILSAIAARIDRLITADDNFRNDQALVDRFAPFLEGLFTTAYDPRDDKSGGFDTFAPWAGAWLAQELVKDERAIRVQVFQATLFAVITEALLDRLPAVGEANHEKLVTAIEELGQTYAWLNPTAETTVPEEDQDYAFLNRLWRLQVPNAGGSIGDNVETVLQESVEAVKRLFTGVEDPVKAIAFLNELMQASTEVTALKQGTTPDIRNPQFLRELKELGIAIALLPVVVLYAIYVGGKIHGIFDDIRLNLRDPFHPAIIAAAFIWTITTAYLIEWITQLKGAARS